MAAVIYPRRMTDRLITRIAREVVVPPDALQRTEVRRVTWAHLYRDKSLAYTEHWNTDPRRWKVAVPVRIIGWTLLYLLGHELRHVAQAAEFPTNDEFMSVYYLEQTSFERDADEYACRLVRTFGGPTITPEAWNAQRHRVHDAEYRICDPWPDP